jgi:hypothetical protein
VRVRDGDHAQEVRSPNAAQSTRNLRAVDAYTREPPVWLEKPHKGGSITGVPLILASDWHWGETVDPDQVGGMNAFNRKIAKQRVKRFGDAVIDLCFHHMTSNPSYPGVVFCVAAT